VGKPGGVGTQVFTLRSESEGRACSLYLQGELDLASFEVVDQVLRDAAQRTNEITIDLTDLTFMDVTGLRLVLEAAERARANGHSMRVTGTSGQVMRLMKKTGTLGRLSIDS
jgi:anti-anti-sigma factor